MIVIMAFDGDDIDAVRAAEPVFREHRPLVWVQSARGFGFASFMGGLDYAATQHGDDWFFEPQEQL